MSRKSYRLAKRHAPPISSQTQEIVAGSQQGAESLQWFILHKKKNNNHENIRVKFFDKVIDLCPNFRYMDTSSKFAWLFTNEHVQVLKKLGSFIEEFFLLRGHNWSYRYH